MATHVLFFDGDCAFCTRSVNRVFALDRAGAVHFAPLQGELAGRHGLGRHADAREGTMVVMREADGAVFLRGDALLELARALGGGWRWCGLGRLVPRPLRDGVYRLIARNRHRFGKAGDACQLPDPEFLKRLRA